MKSVKSTGIRVGNWLSQRQALLSAPDISTVRDLRDRAILAVLLGCGLRRSEVAALTFAHVQQRDGRWCIVDLVGKHGRVRTAPMPASGKVAIDTWTAPVGVADGHVFRRVSRAGAVAGDRLGEKVVCRCSGSTPPRSACPASLLTITVGHARNGAALSAASFFEQIQMLLGHASVQTTERYLGTRQDLVHAPNDETRLRVAV